MVSTSAPSICSSTSFLPFLSKSLVTSMCQVLGDTSVLSAGSQGHSPPLPTPDPVKAPAPTWSFFVLKMASLLRYNSHAVRFTLQGTSQHLFVTSSPGPPHPPLSSSSAPLLSVGVPLASGLSVVLKAFSLFSHSRMTRGGVKRVPSEFFSSLCYLVCICKQ